MSEKIADIVAQMRGRGEDGRMDMSLWRQYADRIEEAAKREKAETEAEALAVGGVVEAARQKHVGNAEALREALLRCEAISCLPEIREQQCVRDMRNIIADALSAPPRQCDVGTPEEHERRWRSNCGHGIPRCCKCAVYAEAQKLGLVNHRYLMKSDCKFVWAQMPYTEEGGAE